MNIIPYFGPAALALTALQAVPAMADTPRSGLSATGQIADSVVSAQPGFRFVRLTNGVQYQLDGTVKTVLFYAPDIVRVNASLGHSYWNQPSLVVLGPPATTGFSIKETAAALTMSGEKLRVMIDKSDGAISFFDASGKLLTREKAGAPQSVSPRTISGAPTYEVENRFTLKPDEAIYGFGFTDDEQVNRRGKDLLLVQTNIGIIIPVMMSTEGYGVLWDTYSQMRFSDGADGAKLWAEDAPGGVDYYLMAGGNMDAVVGAYRRLTGKAPMYPKQAFGLFMSKERYPTQDRLVEVARNFRREGFPLDYIVQDWQYWGSDKDGSWSGMIWDRERYPDPQAMTKTLHDLNLKLMISIWPSVGNDTALAHELDQSGLRFAPLHWISKKARVYDAYSAKGREIYFKYVKSGLLDKGVDALWMDGTEVEVTSAMWDPHENVRDIKALGRNAMGDFSRYLNPYTLLTTEGVYDGQRATSNKRVLTLTRSAWAGAQRTGASSWSGDTIASWATFRKQIAGGVNVTVTGNPYWTQDTGGFFVDDFPGGENNPAYRELFARWFQYAAFNPLMRVHGTSIEREPYIFKDKDPAMYQSLLNAVHLRYRLLPYIYSLSAKVTSDGYTLMRPLQMDFAADKATYDINDSFMFGSSMLVHPVSRPMYNLVQPPAETVPATVLRTADGRPGLSVQYFQGRDLATPAGPKLVDTKMDYNWPGPPLADMPAGLKSLNDFSARWEGELIAPEEGEYEIGVAGDDGYRLFLDGEKVVEDWKESGARYASTRRTLHKGQRVAVRIEYYQAGGGRSLRFGWRTPTELKALAAATPSHDLKMTTYLPQGGDWYDFWNNQRLQGGRTVERDASLDILPLYVRAGSIIPMGPVVQYATEKPDAPLEIRVYPGADGTFTIYEDDNETYAYERGQSARYKLRWDDARRTLSIGARQGSFPGMVRQRQLNVVVIDNGHGGGITAAPATRSISYDGRATVLRFDN